MNNTIAKIELNDEMNKLKEQFTQFAFISFSFMFLLSFILTVTIEDNYRLLGSNIYYYFFSFVITIFIWVLLIRTKSNFDKFFEPIAFYVICNIIYLCLCHCHISLICFIYYIPILIISSALKKIKTTLFLALFFIILFFTIQPISYYFGITQPLTLPFDLQTTLIKYQLITVTIGLFFVIASLFFFYKVVSLKKKHINILNKKINAYTILTKSNQASYEANSLNEPDKFEILYSEILALFESEKPYQNSEFTIKMLSKMLNTNHVYVSKTLNIKANKNFIIFVNEYRINQVLNDFDKRKYKKHTIESIYTNAGFSQQSTFNRVFKDLNGMTPSEYIEQVENNFSNVA